ncbi:30S ribosomal protein S1 [Geobacter sp.]|uniref:30S ribosomal protein S1 n=1 Tax=Geobacter sp. TaxID=46610 RepID=UPI0026070477|nr:30S ribosomal protein S1 [Geobacter sp.]
MTIDDKDFNETTEEESFAELFEKSSSASARLKPGSKVEATILKIGADWVFLDIGKKGEGVLERKELLDNEGNLTAAEGDTITAWFTGSVRNELRFTTKLGAGAAAQSQLEDAWRAGIPVEGYVAKEIKGGFEVKVGGNLRAFCPFSQISLRRAENPAEFVGKHLLFRITEYGERGRNIIVSHRQVLEEEQKVKREALKETLQEGMTISGTVTRLADFGAFVDLGGIDGLIPVSEVAWTRVKHVRDVLSVGDQVSVVIKRIDWEAGKISLSLKDTQPDPWEAVAEQFPEGSYHTGTVARLAAFGAFVSLAPGIDGLIHISKLGKGKRINHPREALNEGETVEVKVDGVDRENRKLSLSLAEVSRAAEEEQKSVASFRQQAATPSKESMGSLGDLLKAKLDEKQ